MVGTLIMQINVVHIIYVPINVKIKSVNVQLDQNGIHIDFDVMIQDILLHHVNEFFTRNFSFPFFSFKVDIVSIMLMLS
jgi:hypothetical protein